MLARSWVLESRAVGDKVLERCCTSAAAPVSVRVDAAIAVAVCALSCTPKVPPGLMPSSSKYDTETKATAELVASMPDTIPCDSAVFVREASTRRGVDAERRWLARFYPGHSGYGQRLIHRNDRSYDVLTFARAEGQPALVCFDITMFFGKF